MKEKQTCRHLPEDDTDTTPPYYHINLLAPYFILPFIYCDGVARRDPRQANRRQAQRSCPLWEEPPEGILDILLRARGFVFFAGATLSREIDL